MFTADKDLALAPFRLYDRIVQMDRLRKESPKSTLTCPQFMEISLLAEENGDDSGSHTRK
jgi:hypothetical protein